MVSQLCLCLVLSVSSLASAADIIATAQGTGDHAILAEALTKANLITTLQGAGPFTVFAPTDTAFGAALTALNITKQELLDRADLAEILTYHVLSGNILSTALQASQTVKTVNSLPVTITKGADVKFASATVTSADVVADNGVIHVIDKVIIPPTLDIVSTAVAMGNFSVLAEALTKANLVATLQGMGPFTVFAPTDAAFGAALAVMNITKQELLDRADLAGILKYHVLNGKILSTSLLATQTVDTLLTGKTATVTKNGTVVRFVDATVTSADIAATNGVIHAIDKVVLPPGDSTSDIVATVQGTGVHTVLAEALTKANLISTLQGAGPFTVFAPTDAAFGVALTALNITKQELLDRADLADILKYHVLNGKIVSTSLLATQTVDTLLTGKTATVTKNGTVVRFVDAMVTGADIAATNGVIHVIDKVVLPPGGTAIDIVATVQGTGDHAVLAEALAKANLISTLQGAGPFTVFAPTDAAFGVALTELGITKQELLDRADLADILKYHVLNGKIVSTSLLASQTVDTLLTGETVTVTKNGTVVRFADTTVTGADVEAANGVIHVIDKVALPPGVSTTSPGATGSTTTPGGSTSDIVVTVQGTGVHTVMAEALTKANLISTLQGAGPFTVFAPTDAAFGAALTELGITKQELLDRADLADILKYHVLNGKIVSTSLLASQTVDTLLTGETVTVTKNGNGVHFADAIVTGADVEAANGVIHVIDKVVLPPGVSTTSPGATGSTTTPGGSTSDIVVIVQGTGVHTVMAEALTKANLISTLQGAGPFTVFAPTDAAFGAALTELGITKQELLDRADLADILKYHVVSRKILSTFQFVTQTVDTLLTGKTATITKNGTVVRFVDATVTSADIAATNGIIHVIDKVVLPPGDSATDIVATVQGTGDHAVLAEALTKANLVTTLQGTGPFTVFAPTDAAFGAALTELGITKQELLDRADLADILKYHVLSGKVLSTSLMATQTVDTLFSGQTVTITKNGNVVHYADAAVSGADMEATNGVIHVIDKVALPPGRSTTTPGATDGGVSFASSLRLSTLTVFVVSSVTALATLA